MTLIGGRVAKVVVLVVWVIRRVVLCVVVVVTSSPSSASRFTWKSFCDSTVGPNHRQKNKSKIETS